MLSHGITVITPTTPGSHSDKGINMTRVESHSIAIIISSSGHHGAFRIHHSINIFQIERVAHLHLQWTMNDGTMLY